MSSASVARRQPLVPNAVLAMLIFLTTELMLFAGLLSAYWVLRAGYAQWPPPGQPRLPIFLTGANTLVLVSSLIPLAYAARLTREGRSAARALLWAAMLGGVFLVVQGAEWARLLTFGLTVKSGYGSVFYTLIGVHATHALAGLGALLYAGWCASQGRYRPGDHAGQSAVRLYWTFVVAVWPALYILLYLV